MTHPYTVYMLRCADGTFYTGIARDVAKRLQEHNTSPKAARYTRGRRPVVLVYQEGCASRSTALSREMEIKQLTRTEKKALIMSLLPRAILPALPVD